MMFCLFVCLCVCLLAVCLFVLSTITAVEGEMTLAEYLQMTESGSAVADDETVFAGRCENVFYFNINFNFSFILSFCAYIL